MSRNRNVRKVASYDDYDDYDDYDEEDYDEEDYAPEKGLDKRTQECLDTVHAYTGTDLKTTQQEIVDKIYAFDYDINAVVDWLFQKEGTLKIRKTLPSSIFSRPIPSTSSSSSSSTDTSAQESVSQNVESLSLKVDPPSSSSPSPSPLSLSSSSSSFMGVATGSSFPSSLALLLSESLGQDTSKIPANLVDLSHLSIYNVYKRRDSDIPAFLFDQPSPDEMRAHAASRASQAKSHAQSGWKQKPLVSQHL
eukprot:TRINITY_DN1020_c0_g1_i4.p1 TRINITY_DN1020_c0_g1~~TRINITY_DN1020_c0_g1_i4.p1  ORF type:complete len:270 (-),score=80.22 TRINITY_DN1020_c0_g1_i4:10-759(-)